MKVEQAKQRELKKEQEEERRKNLGYYDIDKKLKDIRDEVITQHINDVKEANRREQV